MFLAVDIGNTNISLGLFKDDVLISSSSFKYTRKMQVKSYADIFETIFNNKDIKECVIASVVDEITNTVSKSIESVFHIKPLIISYKTAFDLKIKSKHPEKIGMDRLANACAAKKLYPSQAVIVVDMGTATTFDIINKKGEFIGGLIIPGINTQLKSLADNTSKLPNIKIKEADKLNKTINIDTKKAILSGIINGHARAIEGLIEDCSKELKTKPIVIATGGNAKLISKFSKENLFDLINPNLTLEGLLIINNLNKFSVIA